MIKLNNLQQPPELLEAVKKVIESGRFVKGPLVEELEEKWARRCGMKYAIGVSSGAMALELAVETVIHHSVVTYTPWTFKAVPNAILRLNPEADAIPSDDQPDIYAHHLHDQKPDYTDLLLIEDCSHCHGYQPVAETAIFSFYPGKILGAIGDAGIIVTNNKEVYDRCRDLRNHGDGGTNARMDEIQAAALLVKLPYLDWYIAKRQAIVDKYDKALGRKTAGSFHYAYCIEGSEKKKQQLIDAGVESAFYYTPEYMALPLNPFLTDEEIEKVIEEVRKL